MQELQDKLLHIYITDSLKTVAENTSKAPVPGVGVVDYGTILTKRWFDLINPHEEEKPVDDPRTCREITADIFKRIRGDS